MVRNDMKSKNPAVPLFVRDCGIPIRNDMERYGMTENAKNRAFYIEVLYNAQSSVILRCMIPIDSWFVLKLSGIKSFHFRGYRKLPRPVENEKNRQKNRHTEKT